ncbi:hypothetical protein GIB67_023374 [Kingdonia uniflora]|uniref:RING-type E3 ubiquitin transferase n=1 Tax=Kingdonia uniflora TaxID=39325 RepID=A0A7J7LIH5_9MAGN|nr:hypothetical protein GIB67_023374 [Kingdonia uniflora]
MEKYTGKRAVGGLGIAGRGPSLTFKDASNREDGRSVQYCNKLGCSTRPNSMKNTQVDASNNIKYTSSFRPTNVKVVFGSSSKSYPVVTDQKKSRKRPQNLSSQKAVSVEPNTEVGKPPSELLEFTDTESGSLKGSDDTSVSSRSSEDVGSYSVISNTRTDKPIYKRNQENPLCGSTRHSFAPKNTSQTARTAVSGQGVHSSRYGIKNLGCTSISDVLPSGCTSSDSTRGRKAEVEKRRSPIGECSSSRRKLVGGSSSGDSSKSSHKATSVRTHSPSHPPSQPTSRYKYWISSGDSVRSVRTRKTINTETRSRLSEPSVVALELPSLCRSTRPSSSQQSSQDLPTIRRTSSRRPCSRNENLHNRSITLPEDHSLLPVNSLSNEHDVFPRFNIDGIAEEEYVDGDETGKLGCDHRYHVVCIDQWLRLKNWCPVCKAPATAS